MKHCRDSARMIIRNSLPSSQAADPVSHKIFKKIFLVLAGLLALHSSTAFAYCIDPLGGKIVFPSFKFNANSIPINGKIGNEIISGDIPVAQCGSPDLRRTFWIWGLTSHYVTSINGRNIYRTNTPGVGFSFGFEPGNFCQSNGTTWLAGNPPKLTKLQYGQDRILPIWPRHRSRVWLARLASNRTALTVG